MTTETRSQARAVTSVSSTVESLDAFACRLYRKARAAGPEFADITAAVGALHAVLKHLCAEAEDPDSLLNLTDATGRDSHNQYERQLMPVVQDSEIILRQLETVITRYGWRDGAADGGAGDAFAGGGEAGGAKQVDARGRDMMTLIRTKLVNQKTNIDILLDTVQLHSSAEARRMLETANDQQLEAIKDKVGTIASKLFHNMELATDEDDDGSLWKQFRSELVRSGFSSDVLHRNKEVLRAYIRELDSQGLLRGTNTSSAGGLPGNGSPPPPSRHSNPPFYTGGISAPHKQNTRGASSERSPQVVTRGPNSPVERIQRSSHPDARNPPQPYQSLQSPALHKQGSHLGLVAYTPSDPAKLASQGTSSSSFISTRDLMAIDRDEGLVVSRIGSLQLSPSQLFDHYPPPGISSTGASSRGNYFPPISRPLQTPKDASPTVPPGYSSSPHATQQPSHTSPRYVTPDSPYIDTFSPQSPSALAPPPPYSAYPTNVSAASSAPPATRAPLRCQSRRYSHLAPDSRGNEIPLDAKWTKINRQLVSPAVLERSGVRYEARPEFVAVLGALTRAEIEEYARRSVEERRRRRHHAPSADHQEGGKHDGHRGPGSGRKHLGPPPLRRDETYHDRKLRLAKRIHYGESDSDDVLWDESDTTEDECGSGRQRSYGNVRDRHRGRDGYPPLHEGETSDRKVLKSSVDANSTGDPDETRTGSNPRTKLLTGPAPKSGGGKTSPASTVQPKPILKNRNENHVHFDESGPHETPPDEMASGQSPRVARDRGSKYRGGYHDDYRGRREKEHGRDQHRNPCRSYRSGRDRSRESRPAKRSTLRESLGAAGIGGAAASLFSVLTEAAEYL